MAEFTIRVVLHDNATWHDYVNLASHLAARGITDVIDADDGRRFKMPPGEYNYRGNQTTGTVHDIASDAIRKVNKRFSVLVTNSQGRMWSGLEQVR